MPTLKSNRCLPGKLFKEELYLAIQKSYGRSEWCKMITWRDDIIEGDPQAP
jgi:hypothetical protein